MREHDSTAPPRRAALAFIFVTVLLDILALGLVLPILPRLVLGFVGGDSARAAMILGIFVVSWEAMQFFCAPLLGVLSDRFGRRPVILLSNLGLGLDYILMAFAPTLWILFIGRLISGVTSASYATAAAYVADTLPVERRGESFGFLGAAFGIGFVVGPALGGALVHLHPTLPFLLAATLSLANAAYGWFVLPESLPQNKRMRFEWKRANPLGSVRLLRSDPVLKGLGIMTLMTGLAQYVLPATFFLHTARRFGWGERDVGLALASMGICSGIVQLGIVKRVLAALGEKRTLLVGFIFGAAGFLTYGLAPTSELFCLGIPLVALWGLSGPASFAIMTRRVSPSEQGQLQGAISSISAVSGMIGPTIYARAFVIGTTHPTSSAWTGLPYYLAALCIGAASVHTARVLRREPVRLTG